MWTKEDLDEGERVLTMPAQPREGSDIRRETVRALMTRAVELAAARVGPFENGLLRPDEIAWCISACDVPEEHRQFIKGHLRALTVRVATLQAKVEEFRAALTNEKEANARWHDEGQRLRAEVERLKVEVTEMRRLKAAWGVRAQSAESRLAAIRMCLLEHDTEEGPDFVETVNGVRRALEGNAPNPSIPSNGSAQAPQEAKRHDIYLCHVENCADCTRVIEAQMEANGPSDVAPGAAFTDRGEPRYPCSPTCTHEDAAKVGHPERIASRSKAFATEDDGGVLASDEPYPDRAEERSEALIETAERAGFDEGLSKGWDEGAEAMRATIQPEVREWLTTNGYDPTRDSGLDLMKKIEGAAP